MKKPCSEWDKKTGRCTKCDRKLMWKSGGGGRKLKFQKPRCKKGCVFKKVKKDNKCGIKKKGKRAGMVNSMTKRCTKCGRAPAH